MSEVTLTVKGYQFNHPKESLSTSLLIQNASKRSDYRLKAAANLFFATLFNLGNTAYYATSTVLGTVKRFPTEGKKEAKNFLNAEGYKALTTVIYTATTALLTVASLYNSKWALSHIEVKCPPPPEPPREEEIERPLPKGCNYDPEVLAIMQASPEGQLQLLTDVFQHNLESDDYSRAVLKDYEGAFTQDIEIALPILKALLARIVFVLDWENAPELKHVIPVITTELEAAKVNETFVLEKAVRIELTQQIRLANLQVAEESRLLREEQDREFQESIAAELKKAEEALAKGTQEEALGVVETELGQVLEGLNTRLESFAGISADLTRNWQQTEQRTVGHYALDATTIFGFVSSGRVKAVDLGGIDLSKVPVEAALDGLQEKYPLADGTFFERIDAAEKTIQERTEAINILIDYAGLTVLKNAFPEVASVEQKAEHGQLVLDHFAALRQ